MAYKRYIIDTISILILLLILLLPVDVSPHGHPDIGLNTATGYGYIFEGDIARAKKDAIKDAIEKVIIKHLNSLIDKSVYNRLKPMFIEAFVLHPEPYIEGYRLLKEEDKGGVYVVSLKARVFERALKKRLSTIGIPLKDISPRILVMIVHKIDDAPTYWWSGMESDMGEVDRILGSILSERGFPVIDPFTPPMIELPMSLRTPYLNKDDLSRIGELFGATLILYGEVEISSRGIPLFFFGRRRSALLEYKVFSIPDRRYVISGSSDAYPFDQEGRERIQLIYEKIGDDISSRLSTGLTEFARRFREGSEVLKVVLTNVINYKEYTTIRDRLKGMDEFVKALSVKSFSRGRVILELTIRGRLSMFLMNFERIEWDDFGLRVSYLPDNMLILKIIPRSKAE